MPAKLRHSFSTGRNSSPEIHKIAGTLFQDEQRGLLLITIRPAAKLSCLTLGKGMQRLGAHAFSGTAISQVTITDSVTDIGSGAFSGLSQDKIGLGKGYNSHFVAECDTIIGMISSPNLDLVIPSTCNGKTVTRIGYSAFLGK